MWFIGIVQQFVNEWIFDLIVYLIQFISFELNVILYYTKISWNDEIKQQTKRKTRLTRW